MFKSYVYILALVIFLLISSCRSPNGEGSSASIPFPDGTSLEAQKAIAAHIANQPSEASGYIIVDEKGNALNFVDLLNRIDANAIQQIPAQQLAVMQQTLSLEEIQTLPILKQAALSQAFYSLDKPQE
ncbi:MAG: hypothetical protein R2880_09665 [Deinococcales bacterium]